MKFVNFFAVLALVIAVSAQKDTSDVPQKVVENCNEPEYERTNPTILKSKKVVAPTDAAILAILKAMDGNK